MGRAALAVGSGDMDGGELPVRIAIAGLEGERGTEPGLVGLGADVLKHRYLVEKPLYRVLICHQNMK